MGPKSATLLLGESFQVMTQWEEAQVDPLTLQIDKMELTVQGD